MLCCVVRKSSLEYGGVVLVVVVCCINWLMTWMSRLFSDIVFV